LITLLDAHKAVHVAVAVDEAGRELGEWRGPNKPDAWASLAQWAAAFGPACWWGVEGAWGNWRGLAQHLVALGFTVFEISPQWTARLRRNNRRQGKSDRLDARAVARCVREEAPSFRWTIWKTPERLQLATDQADDVAEQIRLLAKDRYEPLTRLCGVNLLTAGTLAGMLGPGRRFESEAQLAAYAGTSPLEASSSGLTRHRLNRGGNRRLNSVIYRIA
jgi:transposase